MNNKLSTAVIAVLCIVIIALCIMLYTALDKPQQMQQGVQAPVSNESLPSVTQKRSTGTPPVATSPYLPAPLNPANVVSENSPLRGGPTLANLEQQKKQARLREILKRFQDFSSTGKTPDIVQLEQMISELIEINGSPIIAGVDFSVLQNNLKVTQKLQELSREIQAESNKTRPDKERLLELTRQLQLLQGSLRSDIMAGGMVTPALPPVTTPSDQKKSN